MKKKIWEDVDFVFFFNILNHFSSFIQVKSKKIVYHM